MWQRAYFYLEMQPPTAIDLQSVFDGTTYRHESDSIQTLTIGLQALP